MECVYLMPTYGYECLSCDNQFEIFQSIKDDALTACGECGGTLRKKIYPVGISFKGSGFYVNDYAPKPGGSGASASEPAKSDAKPETKSPESADAKTETKAEPKTEAKPETKSKPDVKAPAAASS